MQIRLDLYPEGKTKALTLSYDDGIYHDRRLVDILNKYQIKATFHLNSAKFGIRERISVDEVNKLYKGHEVAGHTLNHPHLEAMTTEEVIEEILQDRKNLENITGEIVTGFSYPYGTYNEEVINAVKACGIEYARTIEATEDFQLPTDFYRWKPTCHHRDNSLELGKKYLEEKPSGALTVFYMWGHSHNFDTENNWEVIEDFCKLMSFKPDIWYVTNGELVRYIKALKALKFSADRKIVYNPSDVKVWFHANGEIVELESGEKRKISE